MAGETLRDSTRNLRTSDYLPEARLARMSAFVARFQRPCGPQVAHHRPSAQRSYLPFSASQRG